LDLIRTRGVSPASWRRIIHSWLNRMLLPDTVGTRPQSASPSLPFLAGSGSLPAAATGVMPLDYVPEVDSGALQGTVWHHPCVTWSINSYAAIQKGLLTVEKKGKIERFSAASPRSKARGANR
jgi:aconitate hydratase 2/2-methylisocitrate dehydratase